MAALVRIGHADEVARVQPPVKEALARLETEGLAAQRASEIETAAMRKLLNTSARHLRARALPEFQHPSRSVHERIAEATRNLQVMRMFKQLNDLVLLFGVSLLRLNPDRASAILSENTAIVRAIQSRRAEDAA